MKTTIHKADSRGNADHGWLKSKHTFSFASYYDPNRMGFGLLRVLNDDIVAPSQGFATHPHQNMEIVSIPISGALKHKDSEGNETVIKHGEVQLMSAGTGVLHSEYNDSNKDPVNFLQIWVLPEKKDIAPRYDQREFPEEKRRNQFQVVVSPMDKGLDGIKINQQAYFSLADLDEGKQLSYTLNKDGYGVYFFIIEGIVEVNGERLDKRDAMGVSDVSSVQLLAHKYSKILAIEVPLN